MERIPKDLLEIIADYAGKNPFAQWLEHEVQFYIENPKYPDISDIYNEHYNLASTYLNKKQQRTYAAKNILKFRITDNKEILNILLSI